MEMFFFFSCQCIAVKNTVTSALIVLRHQFYLQLLCAISENVNTYEKANDDLEFL